jgi:hypothetical protein
MFSLAAGHPRMDRTGWAALVRGYEAAAARAVKSAPRGGARVAWRQLMQDQAVALAAHFESGSDYAPVTMDY